MWSFLGVVVSAALTLVSLVLTRRIALDVGRQTGRQESYAFVRWAADHALGERADGQRAGVRILVALMQSDLLDPADLAFVYAVMRAVSRRGGVRQ